MPNRRKTRTSSRQAKTHEDCNISETLLRQLTEGRLLAVLLGRWQEKRPHVLAKEDLALRLNKSTKTIERAMSDASSLSILDWIIIEESLDEGPILERYIQAQKEKRNS